MGLPEGVHQFSFTLDTVRHGWVNEGSIAVQVVVRNVGIVILVQPADSCCVHPCCWLGLQFIQFHGGALSAFETSPEELVKSSESLVRGLRWNYHNSAVGVEFSQGVNPNSLYGISVS